MRVLIVSDDIESEHLSVSRLCRDQATFLTSEGHDVGLIGTVRDARNAGVTQRDRRLHATIATSYPQRFRAYVGLYNPQVLPRFTRLVRDFRPDVVHFHNIHTYISHAALRIARGIGAQVFLTAHDLMLFWGGKLAPYDLGTTREDVVNGAVSYRQGLWQTIAAERLRAFPPRNRLVRSLVDRNVDQVIAVSDHLRSALAQNGFRSVIAVHSGVRCDAFRASEDTIAEFRRRHRLSGAPVILAGGRMSGLKGIDPLLDSFRRLRRTDVKLLLFGRGAEGFEHSLTARVRALGLEDRVVRTGWVTGDDLAAAYLVADVCVNPSLCFETLSMFNLDAAAAARPVVSTFFGGASETVIHGRTGLLVNPYDTARLAADIESLLDDPERARRMGREGHEMIRERFDAATQLRQVTALYGAG